MNPVVVDAWEGLGDSIYLRPAIRALGAGRDVYVRTPWPEMFADLPSVHPAKPLEVRYRVQRENVRLQTYPWAQVPKTAERLRPQVRWGLGGSVPELISESLGLDPSALLADLPSGRDPDIERPYAVVRPVSIRDEWRNTARNPDPTYVARASAIVREFCYRVVAVDAADGVDEKALPPVPVSDRHLRCLPLLELVGLVQHAALVIGGPGWIVPACAAARTDCIIIGGGQGWYNSPRRLIGPPFPEGVVHWMLPDDFCADCHDAVHECPKKISDFDRRFLALWEAILW